MSQYCPTCQLPLMKDEQGNVKCLNPSCVSPTMLEVKAPRKVDPVNAIIGKRYVIAGRTLNEFSIGHLVAFNKFHIDRTSKAVWTNFTISYMICCRTWKSIKRLIYHPRWFLLVKRWTELRLTRYDQKAEFQKFWEYVNLSVENYPSTEESSFSKRMAQMDPNSRREKGSPVYWVILSSIIKDISRFDEYMDIPLERVVWYNSVRNEMAGNIYIDPLDDNKYDQVKAEVDKWKPENFSSIDEMNKAFLKEG